MAPFILTRCDEILKELYKFSNEILILGQAIEDDSLRVLQDNLGYKLPVDFIYIISKHNSFSLFGTEVYGLGDQFGQASIETIYKFEHDEVGNPMFPEIFPFSPDGFGNHYCFDLSRIENDLCPVVFWQHDCSYSSKEEVEVCNNDFVDWIQEVMISWTLEDTNYDGSKRL